MMIMVVMVMLMVAMVLMVVMMMLMVVMVLCHVLSGCLLFHALVGMRGRHAHASCTFVDTCARNAAQLPPIPQYGCCLLRCAQC